LLLILTGIIPFACCPESPKGPYKVELAQVVPFKSNYMGPASLQGDSYFLRSDETYQGDTLLLGLGFYSLLAHQPVAVSLHASALALSCDIYPNFTHLQDKINSVELYSDQPYQGVPAGEPLTNQVSVYHYRDKLITSLAQAITNINTRNFYDGMDMGLGSLVLVGKPDEFAIRTFTVRVAYESGLEQTVTSIPVRW
jgi:hypothetical protein